MVAVDGHVWDFKDKAGITMLHIFHLENTTSKNVLFGVTVRYDFPYPS